MPRDGFGGCWFKCHPLLSKQINHKKAWCNWLLVTQHSVAFIKGCCTMWLRRAGFLLLMCKARQKKKKKSLCWLKTFPNTAIRREFKQKYYLVSVSPARENMWKCSERLQCLPTGMKKGREQRAKYVISLGEACHFHTGGSPYMKGDGGRWQRMGELQLWFCVKM